jgi:hypothetical protein
MKKFSTMQASGNEILKEQKLTIGVDLGDRWSFYCVLDEAGHPDTTESDEACSQEPDSKTNTDERHRYQAQDLPSTAADHVIPR